MESSLNPLVPDFKEEEMSADHPVLKYPGNLPINTLKGYFGEVFAGIIAENFSPFGEDGWVVPAHLFRCHLVVYQYLETLHQTQNVAEDLPGRTGDDCLALQLKNGGITGILYCEAKCNSIHRSDKITEAHEKVGNAAIVDIGQIIAILKESARPDRIQWIRALERLQQQIRQKKITFERYNLISYICGDFPTRKETWIPTNNPHFSYTSRHKLEAVEIHINNIEDFIRTLYGVSEIQLTQAAS